MITKYSKFFESDTSKKKNLTLSYYAFDWDDNILYMPTVIHMEMRQGDEWVPVDVSTKDFAEKRNDPDYRLLDQSPESAFSEFRDNGPRGESAFLEDLKSAISQKEFGPAWGDFVECLSEGALFAIITARGHESGPMRMGVEWLIDNVLTEEQLNEMYNNLLKFEYLFKDSSESERLLRGVPSKNPVIKRYLDNCEFIGVSSPSRGGSPSNPEKAKEIALIGFKEKVNQFAKSLGVTAKIGFSDDDPGNVKHIEDLVKNLHHETFSHIKEFNVKKTTGGDIEKFRRTIESNISSDGTPGLEGSVMKFTQYNNMKDTLFTDSEDSGNTSLKRGSKQLAKMSKEILEEEEELDINEKVSEKNKDIEQIKNKIDKMDDKLAFLKLLDKLIKEYATRTTRGLKLKK